MTHAPEAGSALEGPEEQRHGRTALVSGVGIGRGLYPSEYLASGGGVTQFQTFHQPAQHKPGHTRTLRVPGSAQTHQALKDWGEEFPWSCGIKLDRNINRGGPGEREQCEFLAAGPD